MDVEIRGLGANDAEACDGIVASLPYFFGDPTGIEACRAAVRTQPGLAAVHDGEVVGFLTIDRFDPRSSEITWMAVRAGRRRHGIGSLLVERAAADVAAGGSELLFVLTLGPSVPEDVEAGYAGTRAFYEAMGFVPLRELGLRDWNDEAALVLVRAL